VAFKERRKELKRLVKLGKAAEKETRAEEEHEVEAAKVSRAKEASTTADKAAADVQQMETRMCDADLKCRRAFANAAAYTPVQLANLEEQSADALRKWDEWRQAHKRDVVEPGAESRGGLLGSALPQALSWLVGGFGGGGGAAAAAEPQHPAEVAHATRQALQKRAKKLKGELEGVRKQRRIEVERREAAVEQARRAREELEVSGRGLHPSSFQLNLSRI
jgi:hypothetical protein